MDAPTRARVLELEGVELRDQPGQRYRHWWIPTAEFDKVAGFLKEKFGNVSTETDWKGVHFTIATKGEPVKFTVSALDLAGFGLALLSGPLGSAAEAALIANRLQKAARLAKAARVASVAGKAIAVGGAVSKVTRSDVEDGETRDRLLRLAGIELRDQPTVDDEVDDWDEDEDEAASALAVDPLLRERVLTVAGVAVPPIDLTVEALVAAIRHVTEGETRAWSAAEAAMHPRIKGGPRGGEFKSVFDRMIDSLTTWSRGEGPADPFEGQFTSRQMRETAKKLGLEPRPRISEPELKNLLFAYIRDGVRAGRTDAPRASFTLHGPDHRDLDVGVYVERKPDSKIFLRRESNGKPGTILQSFDDLDALHSWAQEHGETELAGWAAKERDGSKPAAKAAKKATSGLGVDARERVTPDAGLDKAYRELRSSMLHEKDHDFSDLTDGEVKELRGFIEADPRRDRLYDKSIAAVDAELASRGVPAKAAKRAPAKKAAPKKADPHALAVQIEDDGLREAAARILSGDWSEGGQRVTSTSGRAAALRRLGATRVKVARDDQASHPSPGLAAKVALAEKDADRLRAVADALSAGGASERFRSGPVPVSVVVAPGANSSSSSWRATGFDGLDRNVPGATTALTTYLRDPGFANSRLRTPDKPLHNQSIQELTGDAPFDAEAHAKAAAKADKQIAALDRVMEQSHTDSPMTVYRGASTADVALPDGDAVGHEWVDAGFASTALSRRVAEHSFAGRGRVLMTVRVPEGTPALRIDGLGESEVLLGRGQRYRVVADHGLTTAGARHIEVEVVPDDAIPPAEQAARDRQVKIGRADAVHSAVSEVEQLLADGASDRALTARITSRTAGQPDLRARLLPAVGDEPAMRKVLADLRREEGLTPIGAPGDVVPFDPQVHHSIGGDIPPGTPVTVVRPGHQFDRPALGPDFNGNQGVTFPADVQAGVTSPAVTSHHPAAPMRNPWDGPPSTRNMRTPAGGLIEDGDDPNYAPAPDGAVFDAPDSDVRKAVEEAWFALTGGEGGSWAQLADVRERIGARYPFEQVSRVLRDISRERGGDVIGELHQVRLTDRDRDARVNIGRKARHQIAFDGEQAARIRAEQSARPTSVPEVPGPSEDEGARRRRFWAEHVGVQGAQRSSYTTTGAAALREAGMAYSSGQASNHDIAEKLRDTARDLSLRRLDEPDVTANTDGSQHERDALRDGDVQTLNRVASALDGEAPSPRPVPEVPARPSAPRDNRVLDAAPVSLLSNLERPSGALVPTAAERAAFDAYGNDGQAINARLRSGGRITPHIAAMDAAMARSPLSTDVEVWRGVPGGADLAGLDLSGDVTGAEFTDRSFVSTSVSQSVAEQFAQLPGSGPKVVLRVTAPRGTKAVAFSGGDGITESQGELLLERGLTFRVTADHGTVDGLRRLDVEIVPSAPSSPTKATPGRPDASPRVPGVVVDVDALAEREGVSPADMARVRAILDPASNIVPISPIVKPTDRFIAPWAIDTSSREFAWLERFYGEHPTIYNGLARERQIDQAWRVDAPRRYRGMTPEQARDEATARLREAVVGQPVVIRQSEDRLGQILADGRVKNQFESGTSSGLLDADTRARLEEFTFGLEPGAPPGDRPIYGVVSPGGVRPATEGQTVTAYGDVQIVLRSSVADRSTVTVGDSLMPENGATRPAPLTDPDWRAAGPAGVRDYASSRFESKDYIEAQIHGGVSVDDIEEVVFAGQPSPATVEALDRASVSWRVLGPGKVAKATPARDLEPVDTVKATLTASSMTDGEARIVADGSGGYKLQRRGSGDSRWVDTGATGTSVQSIMSRSPGAAWRRTTAAKATPAKARAREVEVDNRVRAAYDDWVASTTFPNGRQARVGSLMSITDLRDRLPDLSREDLDAALSRLARQSHATLSPNDDQKRLTSADRAAALRFGDRNNHFVTFTADGLRREEVPATPAKTARPAKKAAPKTAGSDTATALVDAGDDTSAIAAILAPLRAMQAEARRDALDLRLKNDLQALLKSMGLPVSGTKRQLVDRLVTGLEVGMTRSLDLDGEPEDDPVDDDEDTEVEQDDDEVEEPPAARSLTAEARARTLALAGIETRMAGQDVTPGHDKLHHYWTKDPEGLAKWINSPHQWTALYHHLVKHVNPEMAKRMASAWLHEVTGEWAGSDIHRVHSGKPPRGDRVGPG